jgi:hypothetical protein
MATMVDHGCLWLPVGSNPALLMVIKWHASTPNPIIAKKVEGSEGKAFYKEIDKSAPEFDDRRRSREVLKSRYGSLSCLPRNLDKQWRLGPGPSSLPT